MEHREPHMKLRRLNSTGIERFDTYLSQLRAEPALPPPAWLLDDEGTSEAVSEIEVLTDDYPDRLAAALSLHKLFHQANISRIDEDIGLWSWLTLFYFDMLCPVLRNKSRKVAAKSSYIPEVHIQRRVYRHLLLGPWQMLRLHNDEPDRLRGLLCSPVHIATAETYRLFIENPTLLACKAVVQVASYLYYNSETGKLRRGAGRKETGGCRRFIEYLNHLDCTYDLPLITEKNLVEMLPREFREFMPLQKEMRFTP